MDVSAPYHAISPSLDLDVLVVLAGTTAPLSAHAVRQRAQRGSDRGVRLALSRLTVQGLVDASPAGKATLYVLNQDHLAAPIVHALAALRTELLDRVRADLATWTIAPVHASLFGSTARRDGDTDSDIDLLLVRPSGTGEETPRWADAVSHLTEQIERWTGNHVGLAEISEEEIGRLRDTRPAIVAELEREAIDLAGVPVRQLLRSA